MNEIDFVAAAVAALATLGVGAIWYAPPVFGDAWAREAGLTEKPSRPKALQTMLVGYLISLVVTCTLSWLLGRSPDIEHAVFSCTLIGAVLVGGKLCDQHRLRRAQLADVPDRLGLSHAPVRGLRRNPFADGIDGLRCRCRGDSCPPRRR